LDEDLRFASLIEHLMAAVLTRINELDHDKRQFIFDVVNGLSRRSITPEFDGMVVLTQAGVNRPRESRRISKDLQIVWAGAGDAARVFGIEQRATQPTEFQEASPPITEQPAINEAAEETMPAPKTHDTPGTASQ
jgi:hypothetical protein